MFKKGCRVAVFACAVLPMVANSQAAKTPASTDASKPESSYTGCVTPNANAPEVLVLDASDGCMVLAGKVDSKQLQGHTVTLTGTLMPAAGTEPLTLKVTATQRVAEACSQSCQPEPPGTRGLHGNLKHGREGATKGAHDSTTPPQQ